MEECSMIINDTLMSPSSSPLMDSIREHHTSKSSDEEITEDENGDENEEDEEEADDEDREITDDSNDVNRIERIPILNEENASDAPSPVKRPRACASWYPNAGTTSNSTPDATSGNDNQDEVQDSNQPEDDGDEKMSSESPRTFRLGHALMEDGDLSKTEKLVPDSFSEDSIRDKTDHCEPERRGEAARQHTLEAEGEVKSPSITVDGVPPIRQILRPIGQLEAFVQNMAADVPGSIVPDLTPPTTAYASSSASDALPQGSSPPASNHSSGGNPCSSPMSASKRRASGSSFGTPGVSPSPSSDDSTGNLASPGALQSPAKRRRITNAQVSQNTIPGAENSGSLQNSLNNSPPIIVCGPLSSGNRDRDSGECLPHNVSESVDDTTPGVVGLPSVDSTRSTIISGSRDRTSTESDGCFNSNGMTMVRIDMETGEEEEDREVEPDRTEEDSDSHISDSPATALKQEMAGSNQQTDEDSS
ncbi:hypothetical protein FBUS_05317 [Fasciolopsis buskii]|uniref:Uncharacterized protein n=1 Tax=Fasciolopsis buskii TaxID=27845 RepID=A0A8E0RZ66_9TREM|nr:hypothetical protein FBUS_05317 [Fasciolopsis buski]